MLCSICKKELVVSGQARLETLLEHGFDGEVTLKDRYICPVCTPIYGYCWNEFGGFYVHEGDWEIFRIMQCGPKRPGDGRYGSFVDGMTSALGSFERKLEREQKGRQTARYVPLGFGWRLRISENVVADENGEVKTKKARLNLLHNDTYYTSGISMVSYGLRKILKARKTNSERYLLYLITEATERMPRPEWWRRANRLMASLFLIFDPKVN